MLSSLGLSNFKGIKSGTISDLAQVNLLVGRNNAGKSTILDALLLMRCAFGLIGYEGVNGLEYILRRRVNRWPVGGMLGQDYRELYYMFNAQDPIMIDIVFSDGVETSCEGLPTRDRVTVTTGGVDRKPIYRGVFWNGAVEDAPRESTAFQNVATEVGHGNARLLGFSHLLDTTTLQVPFLEELWEKLIIDRRDAKLRDMLNDIYKVNIEGFSLMPFGGRNRLVALLSERSVALDWLGDGLRYALNILSLGMLLEGTVLMVEELETHQHPESLKLLTQTLFELAKKQHLQLFLTTHSWELMTYALEAAEERDVGLTMHHLNLDREGKLHARAIPRPDAELLMDIGHDPRRIYKYSGVE